MSRDLIAILIISLITTFTWIGFEVYRAATRPYTPKVKKEILNPLDPTLDSEALEILRKARPQGFSE